MEITIQQYDPKRHSDGIYDTCPLHGPKVYMPDRRVQIQGKSVWLLSKPEMRFNVHFFFDVNVIVVRN